MTSITITEAAARLDMHPRTIRRLCAELDIGRPVGTRLILIEERDLKKLARNRRPVGNPNFSRAAKAKPGNGLRKTRK